MNKKNRSIIRAIIITLSVFAVIIVSLSFCLMKHLNYSSDYTINSSVFQLGKNLCMSCNLFVAVTRLHYITALKRDECK